VTEERCSRHTAGADGDVTDASGRGGGPPPPGAAAAWGTGSYAVVTWERSCPEGGAGPPGGGAFGPRGSGGAAGVQVVPLSASRVGQAGPGQRRAGCPPHWREGERCLRGKWRLWGRGGQGGCRCLLRGSGRARRARLCGALSGACSATESWRCLPPVNA